MAQQYIFPAPYPYALPGNSVNPYGDRPPTESWASLLTKVQANFDDLYNQPKTTGNTLVTLGDSITNGGTEIGYGDVYVVGNFDFLTYANQFAGYPFRILYNAGVSGNTTAMMLQRFDSDVVAVGPPTAVTVFGGVNDIFYYHLSAQTAFTNLRAMYEKAQKHGIYVFAFTLLPCTTNTPAAAQRAERLKLNTMIVEYWRGRIGGEVIDLAALAGDPTSTTSGWKAGFTADGTHPDPAGATRLAQLVAPTFAKFLKSSSYVSCAEDSYSVNNGSTNLLDNPMLSGTGGTITGTNASGQAPNGYTVAVTGTATVVASVVSSNTDAVGSALELDITAGALNDVVRVHANYPSAGFSVGQNYTFECKWEMDANAGANAVGWFGASVVHAGPGTIAGCLVTPLASANPAMALTNRMEGVLIPAGTTSLEPFPLVMVLNGSGTAKIRVFRPSFRIVQVL